MSRTIEAKAVISAADKTGNVFDRLAQKIKGAEKNAKALEGIKAPKFVGDFNKELERLKLTEKELQDVRARRQKFMDTLRAERPRASHFFRADAEWIDREVNHWRKMKANIDGAAVAHRRWTSTIASGVGAAALRGAAMLGGVYAAGRVAKSGITASATNQRESARDFLSGMTPEESRRIETEALQASRRYQSVDSATMHERLRDTAMSTRSVDTAIALSDTIAQGTTVLQSLKGKDKAIEEGRKFFAALDVMGKNMDPKEVRELFHGYIKALGVEGEDMDLGGVLQFARQSRAAGGILSNRFLMTTMPGLARDLGDAQLGTALASALSQNVGGRATKQSKAEQQAFGLRDKSGNFLDADMAMRDPDKYAWERLIPALQKKGIDTADDVKVVGALAKIFSNRTVQDVFAKLINQQAQYQGKALQYERAPGLDAAGELMRRDPFVAYEAVFSQLKTLAGQAPVMNAAARGLNAISDAIANINKTIETGKIPRNTFFGAIANDIENVGKGLGTSAADTNEAHRIQEQEALAREIDQKLQHWGLTGSALEQMRLKAFGLEGSIRAAKNLQNMPDIFTPEELKKNEDLQLELARERNRGNYGGRSGVPLPTSDPRGVDRGMPGVGDDAGGMSNVKVEGDVKGQIENNVNVKIDSSGLAHLVDEVKRTLVEITGKIRTLSANSNGPGSTGRTSPDAQAPAGTGFNGVY